MHFECHSFSVGRFKAIGGSVSKIIMFGYFEKSQCALNIVFLKFGISILIIRFLYANSGDIAIKVTITFE